ncbi:MAG TPA: DUF3618 domain-containing protein [Solirubrobacterales bacterium]|nr:DUF3618 domain-containing protein [Solirubrobacterales bacterium]
MSGEEQKSPAEIRAEIEKTRAALGDTVEALAEKTDVKAKANAKKAQAKAKIEENPKPVATAAAVFILFVLWRLLRS